MIPLVSTREYRKIRKKTSFCLQTKKNKRSSSVNKELTKKERISLLMNDKEIYSDSKKSV
jgi:hypothetical protein